MVLVKRFIADGYHLWHFASNNKRPIINSNSVYFKINLLSVPHSNYKALIYIKLMNYLKSEYRRLDGQDKLF